MEILKCRDEIYVVVKSLILLLGIFLVVWIPFRLAVSINYSGLIRARAQGSHVAESLVKKYEQSLDNAFLIPFGTALLLSQSAIWIVALSKKRENKLEHQSAVDAAARRD